MPPITPAQAWNEYQKSCRLGISALVQNEPVRRTIVGVAPASRPPRTKRLTMPPANDRQAAVVMTVVPHCPREGAVRNERVSARVEGGLKGRARTRKIETKRTRLTGQRCPAATAG